MDTRVLSRGKIVCVWNWPLHLGTRFRISGTLPVRSLLGVERDFTLWQHISSIVSGAALCNSIQSKAKYITKYYYYASIFAQIIPRTSYICTAPYSIKLSTVVIYLVNYENASEICVSLNVKYAFCLILTKMELFRQICNKIPPI
jgi:hypothetical protein